MNSQIDWEFHYCFHVYFLCLFYKQETRDVFHCPYNLPNVFLYQRLYLRMLACICLFIVLDDNPNLN
jgi:hypothetical protein